MSSLPPESSSSQNSPVSGSTPLVQALQDGFKIDSLPFDLRIGHTLNMRRQIKGIPSFEEGLKAYRNNRSIPLHEYRPVTLECLEDVAVAIKHCSYHSSEVGSMPAAVTDHSSYELGIICGMEQAAQIADRHANSHEPIAAAEAAEIAAEIRSGK